MEPNQSTEALDEIIDEEKRLTDHLSDKGTWIRLLHMILFGIIFRITELVIFLIAIVQFLFKLLTGESNPQLRSLGRSLAGYVREIAAFLTFDTEARPYPWSDWPSGDGGTPAAAPKRPAASSAKKRPAARPRRRAASRSMTARSTTPASPETSEAPSTPQGSEPPAEAQGPVEPAPGEMPADETRPDTPGPETPGGEEPKDRGGGSGI